MTSPPERPKLPDVIKKLRRNLVNPRPDMLGGYRQIAREHAVMRKTIVALVQRAKALEAAVGIHNSPADGGSP